MQVGALNKEKLQIRPFSLSLYCENFNEISLTPQVENLSSFRYPFLAGVVRCDEAECDGVEAGGRRQDFSEELNFTFKPSILLFQTFKSLDNVMYLISVLCMICLNTSQGCCERHRHHNGGMSVCSESWWSGVGEAAAARDTRHYYPWKHSQEGGDGDLWKWICVLDPLLLLLPPPLLMCRGMCVHKHLRRYLRKTS